MRVAKGKTYSNIQENPIVAITVVDADVMKQFQFKGEATVETNGTFFEELKAEWAQWQQVPQCVVKMAVGEIHLFPPKA